MLDRSFQSLITPQSSIFRGGLIYEVWFIKNEFITFQKIPSKNLKCLEIAELRLAGCWRSTGAGGKPSTWFPPGGLVKHYRFRNSYQTHLTGFPKIFDFPQNRSFFDSSDEKLPVVKPYVRSRIWITDHTAEQQFSRRRSREKSLHIFYKERICNFWKLTLNKNANIWKMRN